MFSLWLGATLLGFAPILVKIISMGPTTIGLYRCALGAIFLLLLAISPSLSKKPLKTLNARAGWLIFLAGALFAADLYCWHRSIIYSGAGIGTILGNTQVFYVSLFGWWVHKEKLTLRLVGTILMGFLGTFLLVWFREATDLTPHDRYWPGIFFGLATGAIYAAYVLTLRKLEVTSKGLLPALRLGLVSLATALVLLGVALGEQSLVLPTPKDLPALLTLAILIQGVAWLLISRSLPKVPVSQAGLLLLSQPLVATLSGAYYFGERLSEIQLIGAAITFGAILFTFERRPVRAIG